MIVILLIAGLAFLALFYLYWKAILIAWLLVMGLICYLEDRAGFLTMLKAVPVLIGVALCVWILWLISPAHRRATQPPAAPIEGVTPARFRVNYFFCFDAEDEIHIEPAGLIADSRYDPYGIDWRVDARAKRGWSKSAHLVFGKKIVITSADPQKIVKFRLWETRLSSDRGCGFP
ncbi:MAG: hypothetical protein AAB403_01255 [Planctomycetota bacterium]